MGCPSWGARSQPAFFVSFPFLRGQGCAGRSLAALRPAASQPASQPAHPAKDPRRNRQSIILPMTPPPQQPFLTSLFCTTIRPHPFPLFLLSKARKLNPLYWDRRRYSFTSYSFLFLYLLSVFPHLCCLVPPQDLTSLSEIPLSHILTNTRTLFPSLNDGLFSNASAITTSLGSCFRA